MTGFRYFAIIAGMRTGSNLLERCLGQFAGLKLHGELFNPAFIGKPSRLEYLEFDRKKREADPMALVAAMSASQAEVLHGFRLFHDHDPRVLQKVLADPECGKIILRRDSLDSFLSLQIARETGQWMLGNESRRISQQARFDQSEFAAFELARQQACGQVNGGLQKHGQTAFWLDYPDIKDLGVLNGIAAYLGIPDRLKILRQPILRQNPEAAEDRVVNPEDLPVRLWPVAVPPDDATRLVTIPNLRLTRDLPLAFAPIPGGPEQMILDWMGRVQPGSGPILAGLDRIGFRQWRGLRQPIMFTCVAHPLPRALAAFQALLRAQRENTQNFARTQLSVKHGLDLPESEDVAAADLRQPFHDFLRFLHKNLKGDTSIPIQPGWASQSAVIQSWSRILPLSVIARSDGWGKSAAYLAELAGVGAVAGPVPDTGENTDLLRAIHTPETEALARRAYAVDYVAFGWGNWGQAACDARSSVNMA